MIFILSRIVDFSRVFWNCLVVNICVFRCYFIIIYWFSVEFGGMLIFQGVDRIFGVIVVSFDGVESGEMLDFSGFARSGYRSGFGDFEVI